MQTQIPHEFLCPITLEIMNDPVVCCGDGHAYNRHAISKWFENSSKSPMTGKILKNKQLAESITLRNIIEKWCAENNFKLESREIAALNIEIEPPENNPVQNPENLERIHPMRCCRTAKSELFAAWCLAIFLITFAIFLILNGISNMLFIKQFSGNTYVPMNGTSIYIGNVNPSIYGSIKMNSYFDVVLTSLSLMIASIFSCAVYWTDNVQFVNDRHRCHFITVLTYYSCCIQLLVSLFMSIVNIVMFYKLSNEDIKLWDSIDIEFMRRYNVMISADFAKCATQAYMLFNIILSNYCT